MKSHAVKKQIIELSKNGHPIKKIATSLGISKNTVRRYLRLENEGKGQEVEIKKKFSWKSKLNWELICEKRQQGYTAKQLYQNYGPEISYNRFCSHLRESLQPKAELALRIYHNPGEKVQVDFCDGVPIKDRRSGKTEKTQLFVGILPFSSYTFAVFTKNQQLESFISAHEAMWAFFGGTTPYVVIDNLKSGVKKAHRYDPEVNPTYCDYGNHRGFAALPARPYSPRDKAAVESGISAIQKSFFQRIKEQNFYSLNELNCALRTFLYEFNSIIMKDYGVSRKQRFEIERVKLLSITGGAYEMVEWRTAKVHPDCCIQVLKSFYSVPFKHRSQTVRVKITKNLISIFDMDLNQLACHPKSKKLGGVVTDDQHFPAKILQSQSFDVNRARLDASKIGPRSEELIEGLLSGDRPLKYLRRVLGFLRLKTQGYSTESLEFAATQAITFSKSQLSFIKSCADSYLLTGGRLGACRPKRDPQHIYLRGGYDV